EYDDMYTEKRPKVYAFGL
uniref:Carcinustatin-13 n=1 Tax=Carcinus maenas TaxID=6759 RepID=ALL13_CARMA|nr:RecName: Full=Carcinustatin-13 [Carcinus maenas]